jgi:histidinol-phosphatase (PHP family)
MPWTNYHTHSSFCDGKAEPEEYVIEAIKNNVVSLGFSSHCPVPADNDWSMPKDRLNEYYDTINALKKKYNNKLEIYTGLELDFVQNVDIIKDIDISRLDYTIGSVHFLSRKALKFNRSVDDETESIEECINRDFSGNVKTAVETYYLTVQESIRHTGINIIGHLDIIKKNNYNNKFFNEKDSWYVGLINDTLDLAFRYDKIIEVNNGGITRKKINSLYPSEWILERCFEMAIPVTMSSDAHSPEQIVAGFGDMAGILSRIGFKEILIIEQGKWKPKRYSAEGLKL